MIGTFRHFGTCGMRALFAIACFGLPTLVVVPAVGAAKAAQEQVSKDFQKTVTIGAGQGIHVEHKFGEVKIHGEQGRDVKIAATIHAQAESRAEAETFAAAIRIEVEQSASGVSIRTVYPDTPSGLFHRNKNISYSVDYDIAAPADAAIFVKNSFGNANV